MNMLLNCIFVNWVTSVFFFQILAQRLKKSGELGHHAIVTLTNHRAPVAQLVEHRAATREVVSSTLAGPTVRVLK